MSYLEQIKRRMWQFEGDNVINCDEVKASAGYAPRQIHIDPDEVLFSGYKNRKR